MKREMAWCAAMRVLRICSCRKANHNRLQAPRNHPRRCRIGLATGPPHQCPASRCGGRRMRTAMPVTLVSTAACLRDNVSRHCAVVCWRTGCCSRCRIFRLIVAARRPIATLHGNAADWPDAERGVLALLVVRLIEDPRFAAVFAAGSRAEVPLIGRLMRPGRQPLTVSRSGRPPDSDRARNPDRRLQDQSRAATRTSAAYHPPTATNSRSIEPCCSGYTPTRPSARSWSGPKRLKSLEVPPAILDEELARIISP